MVTLFHLDVLKVCIGTLPMNVAIFLMLQIARYSHNVKIYLAVCWLKKKWFFLIARLMKSQMSQALHYLMKLIANSMMEFSSCLTQTVVDTTLFAQEVDHTSSIAAQDCGLMRSTIGVIILKIPSAVPTLPNTQYLLFIATIRPTMMYGPWIWKKSFWSIKLKWNFHPNLSHKRKRFNWIYYE